MLFDYLKDRIQDPYVWDELRKWGERLLNGVPCTGHRVETKTKSKVVLIRTDHVTLSMSQDQAVQLAKDIFGVMVDKTIKEGSGRIG